MFLQYRALDGRMSNGETIRNCDRRSTKFRWFHKLERKKAKIRLSEIGGWLCFRKTETTFRVKSDLCSQGADLHWEHLPALWKEPQRPHDEKKTGWRHEEINITWCVWPVLLLLNVDHLGVFHLNRADSYYPTGRFGTRESESPHYHLFNVFVRVSTRCQYWSVKTRRTG